MECVRALLSAGADREAQDADGYTPLLLAVLSGEADSARALLAAGAKTVQRDPKLLSLLHAAAEGGRAESLEALLAAGVHRDAKNQARTGAAQMQRSCKRSAPPFFPLFTFFLVLMSAPCVRSTPASLISLISLTPLPHPPPCPQFSAWSALLAAASKGHLECVILLLAAGVDPNGSAVRSGADTRADTRTLTAFPGSVLRPPIPCA